MEIKWTLQNKHMEYDKIHLHGTIFSTHVIAQYLTFKTTLT